jgi:glucokinase-like ROK family protein
MAERAAPIAKECPPGLVEVLDYTRRHGSCTRAELVAATGLSRALVGQRLAALEAYGLVAEDGVGPSTGGRAPRRVRFRADVGHLLVADLGATSVDVAVADLAGGILTQTAEEADVAAGPDVVLGRVEALFDECLERVDPPGPLLGIGVGVPGPVEFHAGRPISPPIMPGWDGYGIPERLERFGVPVWIDNDVNVMALGELTAGIGRGRDNFVFVKIGTGIGAGIVLRGELYRGVQGCAGDVGHVQVPVRDREDVICRCGNVNCLEALAGGGALARDAELAARDGRSPFLRGVLDEQGTVDARDVTLGAAHGDPTSVELLTNAGRFVGQVVATMVNIFNPSLVVIGGGVAGAGDGLLATIRQTVYRRSLPLSTRNLAVHRSALGNRAGVVGAATMVADELFAPGYLPRWLDSGVLAASGATR